MKKTLVMMLAFVAAPLWAEPAEIDHVGVSNDGTLFTFNVTISHPDSGWDHYIDAWRVVDAEGNVLGTRPLAHPHVDEQPFMRSLSNVEVPDGISTVYIEAHDSVDGWSRDTNEVKIR